MSQPFPWELDNVDPTDLAAELYAETAARIKAAHDRHDEDVIDAEIVEEEPEPTDALALVLADDTRRAVLSYRDPAAVAVFAKDLRRTIRENVRTIMNAAAEERIDSGKPTAAGYAAEWQVAADVAETLTDIADAIRGGVEVAEDHSAMLLDDVTDPSKRTRSVRVGDGHGRDLKVGMTQGTALSVDQGAILDLIVALTVARDDVDDEEDLIRIALDTLLELVSGPSWKSSALDVWKRQLEDAGRHAEAITLGHAYGRVDKGEPRLKLERVDRAKRATS